MKESNPKLKLVLIAVLFASLLVGAAVATYLMVSNSLTITVNPATLALSTDSSTTTLGGSVTLTATCSDTLFSGTVYFLANETQIGTSTAVNGVATYLWTPSTDGTYTVYAKADHT